MSTKIDSQTLRRDEASFHLTCECDYKISVLTRSHRWQRVTIWMMGGDKSISLQGLMAADKFIELGKCTITLTSSRLDSPEGSPVSVWIESSDARDGSSWKRSTITHVEGEPLPEDWLSIRAVDECDSDETPGECVVKIEQIP